MKDDFEIEDVLDRLREEYDERKLHIGMNVYTKVETISNIIEILYVETKAKHYDCSLEVMALICAGQSLCAVYLYADQKECNWTDASAFIDRVRAHSIVNLEQYMTE